MGRPRIQQVKTTQKQELDPIAQGYFWSGQLPEEKLASLRRINERVYGYAPGTLQPSPMGEREPNPIAGTGLNAYLRLLALNPESRFNEYYGNRPFIIKSTPNGGADSGVDAAGSYPGPVQGPNQPSAGGGFFGYDSPIDMIDGGGRGASGGTFQGGGRFSDIANAVTGRGPEAQKKANGGIVTLANGGMVPPMMGGRMPNLGDRDMAYQMAMRAMQPSRYAMGGYVEGPGTGTSDSIPAKIYQDGRPVQEAALSDGEFVMTERAVRGAGNGDPRAGAARMYEMMRKFERGGRVS